MTSAADLVLAHDAEMMSLWLTLDTGLSWERVTAEYDVTLAAVL